MVVIQLSFWGHISEKKGGWGVIEGVLQIHLLAFFYFYIYFIALNGFWRFLMWFLEIFGKSISMFAYFTIKGASVHSEVF